MQERSPAPIMTWMLCGLCVLVTLANSTSSPGTGGLWSQIGHCTDSTAEYVWDGHYTTLVTSIFLHANVLQGIGITHLIFNLFWLNKMGSMLERTLDTFYYFLFWVAAAAVGSCSELALSSSIGIGASGVVYAMFGLLWAGRNHHADWRELANPDNLRLFIGWGLFCVVMTMVGWLQVANGAHAGGLLFGCCIGVLVFVPRQRLAAVIVLCAHVTLCMFALTYMPWSAQWTWWKADREFDSHQYAKAIDWYQRSLKRGSSPNDMWENIAKSWYNLGADAAQRGDYAGAVYDEQHAHIALQNAGDGPAESGGP